MTGSNYKESCCRAVSVDTVRTDFFIVLIYYFEVNATDVGKSYLHVLSKENIYTVAGNKLGYWEEQVLVCVGSIYNIRTYMARCHEKLPKISS